MNQIQIPSGFVTADIVPRNQANISQQQIIISDVFDIPDFIPMTPPPLPPAAVQQAITYAPAPAPISILRLNGSSI